MRTPFSTLTKAALVSLLALLSFSATTAHASGGKSIPVVDLAPFGLDPDGPPQSQPEPQPLVYADVTCFLFTPAQGFPYVRYRAFVNFRQIGQTLDEPFVALNGQPYSKWLALQRIECRAVAERVCDLPGIPGSQTVTISSNILATPTLIHQCSN